MEHDAKLACGAYSLYICISTGSSDFFGLNHYTTRLVSLSYQELSSSAVSECEMFGVKEHIDPTWKRYCNNYILTYISIN